MDCRRPGRRPHRAACAGAGVTRGGFYWHFADRRALLEEMLDAWERTSVDEVVDRVDSEGGDARAKLRRLSAFAASSDEPLRIDLAVRDWARREQTIADYLRRIDNRRRFEREPESSRSSVCAHEQVRQIAR